MSEDQLDQLCYEHDHDKPCPSCINDQYDKELLEELQNLKDKLAEREKECAKYREMLEKISKANQYRPELGQLIGSEHYEAAWLDCVDIAKAALDVGKS